MMRACSLFPSHLVLTALLSSSIPIVFSETSTPTPSPTAPSSITQPILRPNRDDVLTPGTTFLIQWTPSPHFSNITLEIWDKTPWGYSRDFGSLCYHFINPFCGTITTHTSNTGSFEWNIPRPTNGFPRGERVFWIKMYVDDFVKPDIGNTGPVLSYSQNFAFSNEDGAPASASGSDTVTMPSPAASGEPLPGTVFVTVHDGISTSVVVGTSPAPSEAMTGIPKQNSTVISSKGAASTIKQSISAAFLMLIGLL